MSRSLAVILCCLAAGCGTVGIGPIPPVALQLLAAGFSQPVHVTHAGDGSGRFFIVEQGGVIRIVRGGATLSTPFLDITSRVTSGGEMGLLSMAFHPQYATSGRFFVNYTTTQAGPVRLVVAEYRVSAGNPDIADPAERVVIQVDKPSPGSNFTNHNGGLTAFGPDGMLYISFGDGGGSGDPLNSGQQLNTLLGKILRVNVDGAVPYAIPPDNPFAAQSGARGEIWAYGLRNPWRFSFDRLTGRLFVADVGQNAWEEVNQVRRGDNLGWSTMEGAHCFNPPAGCDTTGLVLPIAEYDHSLGCSVTGGHLYRGMRIPSLRGRYVFGDFCSGRVWALTETAPGAWGLDLLIQSGLNISSFGEDASGELYVVDHNGAIYALDRR